MWILALAAVAIAVCLVLVWRSSTPPETELSMPAPAVGTGMEPAPESAPADEPEQSMPLEQEVTFTASGDFSASDSARAVFAQIASLDPDFHLALGDFSYGDTDTEQQWCDLVTSYTGPEFPFQLLAGNHESRGRDGHIDEFAECLPNRLPGLEGTYGRQWYVDVPQENPVARIVMISPGMNFGDGRYSYESGTPEYQWTADAIDGARAESIPWVVVGMHSPCLSLGEYDCRSGTDINDLIINKGVDLVLHGHEHLYQRTHQLSTGPGCDRIIPDEFLESCVADDDADMDKGAGTVFVTVGTGGAELRDVDSGDPEASYFAATSGDDTNPTHGSLEVRITPDRLEAAFRPAATGSFTDAFNIRGSF